MSLTDLIGLTGLALGLTYFVCQWAYDRHKWTRELSEGKQREANLAAQISELVKGFADEQRVLRDSAVERDEQKRLQELLATEMTDKERYARIVINENMELNIQGLKTKVPTLIELQDVYVPLKVTRTKLEMARLETDRESQIGSVDRARIMSEDSDGIRIGLKELFHQQLKKPTEGGLPSRALIILIAGPGAGKSTFLQFAALTFAMGHNEKTFSLSGDYLPLLIRLRELNPAELKDRSLATLATEMADKRGYSLSHQFFRDHLEHGDFVVMLDGLDEVPTPADRLTVIDWIRQASASYADNAFIVTSRPAGYPSHELRQFVRLEVDEFDKGDIKTFCEYWIRAVETTLRGDTTETRARVAAASRDLYDAIESKPQITRLASNPLLLSIIALVHRYRARLPERRVELYSECLDVLLEHWDAAKKLSVPFPAHQAMQVLQPTALQYHLLGTKEMERSDLRQLICEYLPRARITEDTDLVADEFLEAIRDRSGVLTGYSTTSYGFAHLTFQEFLAAREIMNTGQESLLVDKFGDAFWKEVTLLYVGLRDATSFFQQLVKSDRVRSESVRDALDVLLESVACQPSVENELVRQMFEASCQLVGDTAGTEWLETLMTSDRPDLLARFASDVMLSTPVAPVARYAAWKFFRNGTLQKRFPKTSARLDDEVRFSDAVKRTETAVLGVGRSIEDGVEKERQHRAKGNGVDA